MSLSNNTPVKYAGPKFISSSPSPKSLPIPVFKKSGRANSFNLKDGDPISTSLPEIRENESFMQKQNVTSSASSSIVNRLHDDRSVSSSNTTKSSGSSDSNGQGPSPFIGHDANLMLSNARKSQPKSSKSKPHHSKDEVVHHRHTKKGYNPSNKNYYNPSQHNVPHHMRGRSQSFAFGSSSSTHLSEPHRQPNHSDKGNGKNTCRYTILKNDQHSKSDLSKNPKSHHDSLDQISFSLKQMLNIVDSPRS